MLIITDKRKTVNLKQIKQFVITKHSGKCLSTEYKNNRTHLKFECKFGHQWNAIWTNVKRGHWCNDCNELTGERITRLYFEAIFEKKFLKIRPDWLINKNNYKLELDGYCEELKISFEHNGLQHYQMNEFVNTQEKLDKIQEHDRIKIEACKKNNVNLIIIPQVPRLLSIEKLKYFIKDECAKFGLIINVENVNPNINLLPINNEFFKKYQDIAISKGGKCISTEYINYNTKMEFKCKEGHIFKKIPYTTQFSWCRTCGNIEANRKKKAKRLKLKEILGG